MPTYLVRWPNGLVSIATADDMKDLSLELAKDEVCTERERVKEGVGQPARADHGVAERLSACTSSSTTKRIWSFTRSRPRRGRRCSDCFRTSTP